MALTFTLIDAWDDGKRVHVTGTVAASGMYAAGGDTLDLSHIDLNALLGNALEIDSGAATQPPMMCSAWMDGIAGYDYVYDPGAAMNGSMTSCMVKILQDSGSAEAFHELAAGAYPEAIAADPTTFYGIFKRVR